MSIVNLKKVTLCGLKSEKMDTLTKLQAFGGAHLISLNKLIFSPESETHKHTEKAIQAVKYLNQCAKKRHQVNDKENFNLDAVVQRVLEIQTKLRDLADERDFLINRIEEVKPWGDFTLLDSSELAGLKCWFYIIPKRLVKKIDADLVYQVVHEDNIHCYVVVLAKEEPAIESVPVLRSHTGHVPLSELINTLREVELSLEDTQAERESLTRWIALITLHLAENEDNDALQVASSLTLDEENLFTIQAWAPEKHLPDFEQFSKTNGLALLVEDIELKDHPPTLLENPDYLAGGEEVIKFYQVPAYNGWDPSVVVFFSFAFFFAMILSDAGYAAIFALILAVKWKKLGRNFQGKRLRVLAFVTIVFSLLWGVLTGGYLGYSPAPESFAGSLKVFDINDFENMMRLSIAVGVVHIVLANLVNALQLTGKKSALASIGWISLNIGGFLLWLAIENSKNIAYGLLIFGAFLLLFFSSERKVHKFSDVLMQLLDGFKSFTLITKAFGDVLSYMRLFALGLASASLALTFNQLADQVYASSSGLGLLSSILILLFGHTLNLMLCLMSGVVHGLRLNFIEFYNWSVSEEGYPFKAFSLKRQSLEGSGEHLQENSVN